VHPNERTGGPYLTAVFFCERVLREADGTLSFIRLTERLTVMGVSESIQPTVFPLNVVVMARSGTFRGSAMITLTPSTPSGQQMPPIPVQMLFEGDDDRGCTGTGTIGFPITEQGAYWFDVSLNGMSLTRTAVRVVYLRNPALQMLQRPGGQQP
jgi:hypothetical protein